MSYSRDGDNYENNFFIQSKKLGYWKQEAVVQSFIHVTFCTSGPLSCDK